MSISPDSILAELNHPILQPRHKNACAESLNDIRDSLVCVRAMLGQLSVELFSELSRHDADLKKLEEAAAPLRTKIAAVTPPPLDPDCILDQRARKGLETLGIAKSADEIMSRLGEAHAESTRQELQNQLYPKQVIIERKANTMKRHAQAITIIDGLTEHVAQVADTHVMSLNSHYHADLLARISSLIANKHFLRSFHKTRRIPVEKLPAVSWQLEKIMPEIATIEATAKRAHDVLPGNIAPATKACLAELADVMGKFRKIIRQDLKRLTTPSGSPSKPIIGLIVAAPSGSTLAPL